MLKPLSILNAVQIFALLCFCTACNDAGQKNSVPETGNTADHSNQDSTQSAETDDSLPEPINFLSARIPKSIEPIELKDGDRFNLRVPVGMKISVAYETGSRIRFMAWSPDKRLFITDMKDQTDNKRGAILIFEDWDDVDKKFNKKTTYLSQLHNPNDVGFYDGYIYIAQTNKLVRYPYKAGDSLPSGKEEVIANFPDYGLGYKYGGWHLTRSLAFYNQKVYVSVGSSCNACIEKEAIRASILQMNPDGSDQKIYATGLRNSVGIGWIGNELWVTSMGRDWIGDDRPEDLFQKIDSGGNYGWPYYYQYKQKVVADEEFLDSPRTAMVKAPPVAFMGMKAHSAALGFEYMKDFDDRFLKNSVLICLHGPVVIKQQIGYSIIKAGANDIYVDVVSGFLTGKTKADKHGRPCDVMMKDEQSFFFTDDHKGVLYYVYKE